MQKIDKMNEIKISVVIPVYNAEHFLRPCLDSIQKQTLDEIEIICVDDGSKDNSLKILLDYQKQDDRLIVLQKKHKKNSGGGAARNIGVEKARGKYLAILDDDDFFDLDMLESVYNRAEQMQAQIVICNSYEWHYDNRTGKEIKVRNTQFSPKKEVFSGVDEAEYLFQITGGAAWHGLFLRKFILEKNIRFPEKDAISVDDLPFIFEAMARADRITVLNSSFLHHRLNTGENQSRKVYMVPMYKAFMKLKGILEKEHLFDVYRCTFLNAAVRRIIYVLNAQSYERFTECYGMLKGEISANLELNFYLDLPSDKIYNPEAYSEYKRIMELSSDEYFAEKKKQAMLIWGYRLPKEIDNRSLNIVLYGAGVYGRAIYERIRQYDICCISRWVDQDYKKIGPPVQSSQTLKGNDYDYVLIAIIDERTVKEVKRMLSEKGIEEKMILTLTKD